MKLGIIARQDLTGLGIQSRNFVRLLKPDKLIIIDSTSFNKNEQHPEWYKDYTNKVTINGFITPPEYDLVLDGIDTLLTFEIPYSHGHAIVGEARKRGIKTVIHNNWEFTDYLSNPNLPLPDALVNHSLWHLSDQTELFPKITGYMPTPTFIDDYDSIRAQNLDRVGLRRRFLHVAGRKTHLDRNGTDDLVEAISSIPSNIDFELVIRTQSVEVPNNLDPRITVLRDEPDDERDMYRFFDAMILPRRYAGACLVEGSRIMSPIDGGYRCIESLRVGDLISDINGESLVTGIGNRLVGRVVKVDTIIGSIESSDDHIHMVTPGEGTGLTQKLAREVSTDDWMFVRRPDGGGINSVHMGAKPTVRALSNWLEDVPITPDLARVIGLWLAEGYGNISPQKGRDRGVQTLYWSFGPDEERFAKYVVDVLSTLGATATYRVKTSKKTVINGRDVAASWTYEVRCRSTLVYQLFEKLGLGHGSHNKIAPNLSADLAGHMIGGWIDGNGCGQKYCIEGYSESSDLIRTMSSLLLKVGIMHSINRNGKRIQIFGTERLKIQPYLKRVLSVGVSSGRKPFMWRSYNSGWVVKVKGVSIDSKISKVFSIETDSGTYIANNLATHNCLPMQEALSAGLPVIMPDIDPNNKILPSYWLFKAAPQQVFMTRTKVVVYKSDTEELAARIAQLAVADDTLIDGFKRKAYEIAASNYSPGAVNKKWKEIKRIIK